MSVHVMHRVWEEGEVLETLLANWCNRANGCTLPLRISRTPEKAWGCANDERTRLGSSTLTVVPQNRHWDSTWMQSQSAERGAAHGHKRAMKKIQSPSGPPNVWQVKESPGTLKGSSFIVFKVYEPWFLLFVGVFFTNLRGCQLEYI